MNFFLTLSIILFLISSYAILKLLYVNSNTRENHFMVNESARIMYNNAEAKEDYTSQGRVYTRGLALIKKDGDSKFTLTSQAKVCDIGLC
jgi:predicted small secreted protein